MEIQVGNKTLEVTLLSKEGNQVKIDIDGKVYDVDVAMLQNGTCSLIYDGNSYNALYRLMSSQRQCLARL